MFVKSGMQKNLVFPKKPGSGRGVRTRFILRGRREGGTLRPAGSEWMKFGQKMSFYREKQKIKIDK